MRIHQNPVMKTQSVVITISLALLIMLFSGLCWLYVNRLNKTFNAEAEKHLQANNDTLSWYVKNVSVQNLNTLFQLSLSCKNTSEFFSESYIKELHERVRQCDWDRLGIALPDGSYLTSSGHRGNISHRLYFQKALSGEHSFEYVGSSIITNRPVVAFAVPIYDNDHNVVAAMVAIYEHESLIRLFDSGPQIEAAITYIIDAEGTLVWSKTKDIEWKLSGETNVFQTLNYLQMPEEKSSDIVRDILQTKKSGIMKINTGRPYYFLYTSIDNTDWLLFSLLPEEMVKKDINSFFRFTIIFVVGALFIFILFCSLIIRMLNHHRKILYEIAYTDTLLKVPNRNWFDERILPIISTCTPSTYAYVVVDVEKFKLLNERFGYENGNKMLRHVFDSIHADLQEGEFASRIAFDDFCMLLKFETGHLLKLRLSRLAEQINTFPKQLEATYFVTLLFGVYVIETDQSRSVNMCYDCAEIALNSALKKPITGFARIGFYHEQAHLILKNNKYMENRMESALIEGEFLVYLQPKVNIVTDTIIGAEALIRWNDPKKGLIPPDQFVPLFEQNGMIAKLDVYVFEEVCRLLRRWIDTGKTPIPISVNLSRSYIANETFLERYEQLRAKYNVPVSYLEFELTESMAFDNLLLLRRLMTEIKNYGYATALDDFGSGYSSLNVLKDLPVDTIKLDKVFFKSIDDKDEVSTIDIIECIVNLADKLDMKIVAEGIELEKQIAFLRYIGCNIVQGYVYSKPIPIVDFERMLFVDS